ncbi:MAG: site-2 protease family protein, partial [Chitinophagales bacterium]|nr:site-2 protease family protein [Chitinophagales bacterium]
ELVVADSAFKDKMRGEVLFDLKATIKIEDFSDSLKNAKEAGLQKGDILKAIDSVPVEYFTQMSEMFKARKGQSVPITVDRNGTEQTMLTQVDEHGRIGILTNTKLYAYDSVHYSFGKALSYGTRDAFEVFYFQAVSLVRIFRGDIPARESISSPIGITKLFAPKWDWTSFWILTALLSMVLAFMNLLPIPALDGGHIMFIAIESITGRKLSDKFMERAQLVGMILLLSLMVFAVGNDIVKMFN